MDKESVDAWLAGHCAIVEGTLQGAVLCHGDHGARLESCHPPGRPVPAWLTAVAAAAMESRRPVVQRRKTEDGRAQHVVAHPLAVHGNSVGAAVLHLDLPHAPEQAHCGKLETHVAGFAIEPARAAMQRRLQDPSQALLEILSNTMACRGLHEGAAVLASAIAGALQCDRVTVALRRRDQTRIVGSSDAWEYDAASHEGGVCAAIDEAMDAGNSIVIPPPTGHANSLVAAHAHLSDARGSLALCTVPLAAGGEMIGALLAERRHAEPFASAELEWLETTARTAAPWLAQVQRLDMPLHEHARAALLRWAPANAPGRHRLGAIALVVATGALLGWPIDHEISAPVKLEGAMQRLITSPADSFLEKVMVRPGDTVKEGQLLLEFASEDLRVERQRLNAELAGSDAAAGDAMSRQDTGTMALKLAKVAELKAQLALLDRRLEKARVVAPFDAAVIQGDLGNALGAPMKRGDVLLTLAPVDNYRAIVEVADSDIAGVRVGQGGAMVLTALPELSLPMRVKRITPLAATAPGRSFFDVEVELRAEGAAPRDLRPGMRGVARLHGPYGPRGLAWFRDAARWLRLAWWRWVG